MSTNQRIGLLVAAVAVAVVAFVIAQSSGDDGDNDNPTPATNSNPASEGPEVRTEPDVTRISVKDGVLVGEPQTIEVNKGDVVRIVVRSDTADEIHLHGYDIEREAAPGEPARFRFKANIEGAFELESHAAEHAGEEPLLARLQVEP